MSSVDEKITRLKNAKSIQKATKKRKPGKVEKPKKKKKKKAPGFKLDARVVVSGLKKQASLNGREGTIMNEHIGKRGEHRWEIQIDEQSKTWNIKDENLTLCHETDSEPESAAESSPEESSDDDGSDADMDDAKSESGGEDVVEVREPPRKRHKPNPPTTTLKRSKAFHDLNLSRPLLKAVKDLGFTHPTPIQAAAIPVALGGADVLGNAVTGSGKTAAFMLPILERLLYRPKDVALSRVLVLTPSRELAAQCHDMTKRLSSRMDVEICFCIGGLSLKQQAIALRSRPDIIIATPGRLVDHLRNSQGFHLDDLEILVLDEADRLLELGFTEEVGEIIRHCPKERQTMLFSATLGPNVMKLASFSLKDPKRISVDAHLSLAQGLTQQFVRVRDQHEKLINREAMVLAMCSKSFTNRVMIFCPTKKGAHRLKIVFGLKGLKAAELHGNLSQTDRLAALGKFKTGEVAYLICTDLASRGLDVPSVSVVINLYFPHKIDTYIHRVGRTARAGKEGIAVTLVGSKKRPLLKEVVSAAKKRGEEVQSRTINSTALDKAYRQIQRMEPDITQILEEELLEKRLRIAEQQANKGANMIIHEKEIFGRPKRTWFKTEKEKRLLRQLLKKQRQGTGAVSKTLRSMLGEEGEANLAPQPGEKPEERERPMNAKERKRLKRQEAQRQQKLLESRPHPMMMAAAAKHKAMNKKRSVIRYGNDTGDTEESDRLWNQKFKRPKAKYEYTRKTMNRIEKRGAELDEGANQPKKFKAKKKKTKARYKQKTKKRKRGR